MIDRVFADGPTDRCSIPGRVIPKIKKFVLDASLFNTQHYKVRIKSNGTFQGKGAVPFPTPWYSMY